MKGVDEIDWFTERPDRVEGTWKAQKLLHKWDNFFATSEPNAQVSFKTGDERELLTFEMLKPKYNKKNNRMNFKIDAEIINKREGDMVVGLNNQLLSEVILFIDDAVTGVKDIPPDSCMTEPWRPGWYPDGRNMNLVGQQLAYIDLEGAELSGAILGGNFESANFSGANLSGANIAGGNFRNANFDKAVMTHLKSQRYIESSNYSDRTQALIANGASMVGASLEGADLQGAKIDETDFSKANLTGANLSKADFQSNTLSETILNQADLYQTDFTGTDLTGATFVDAKWLSTICTNGKLNGGGTGRFGEGGTDPCNPLLQT